jgi:putative transposase
MRYVSWIDRKQLMPDLRKVYSAANAEDAARQLELFDDQWGIKYPMVAQAWRTRWEYVTPFLSLPADLRPVVYTTNAIEGLNRQVRKAIKTRGHFPTNKPPPS